MACEQMHEVQSTEAMNQARGATALGQLLPLWPGSRGRLTPSQAATALHACISSLCSQLMSLNQHAQQSLANVGLELLRCLLRHTGDTCAAQELPSGCCGLPLRHVHSEVAGAEHWLL